MTRDILRLECDNLVIGAGLAGLVAALRLRGKTVVTATGLGATAVSGGVFSLPEARDLAAEQWLLDTLRDTGCLYVEGRYMTDMFAVGRGLVQETTDFEGTPAVVSFDGPSSCGTSIVAVERFSGRSCQEIAHMIESDDGALETLGTALAEMGADSYLLPPVLGITRAREARSRLEKATGARVWELVTAPSVLGLRLDRALREAAWRKKEVTLLETTTIDSLDGGARGCMGTKGRRDILVQAPNLVIATGGPLTGFRLDGDRVYEPLTGVTVSDVDAGLLRTFADDHPLMFKGIGTQLQAAGGFRSVRAVGAVATGYSLYQALITGYHAGDDL